MRQREKPSPNCRSWFLKTEPRKPSFLFLNFEVRSVFRKPISKIFIGFRTPLNKLLIPVPVILQSLYSSQSFKLKPHIHPIKLISFLSNVTSSSTFIDQVSLPQIKQTSYTTCIYFRSILTRIYIYGGPKIKPPSFIISQLHHISTDFQNSFTVTNCNKFVIK